jgi:hypothetical protein
MNKEIDTCENCMFCRYVEEEKSITKFFRTDKFIVIDKRHECRINPPASDGWPKVSPISWCSKHSKSKESIPLGFGERS